MSNWFTDWFNSKEYLELYKHRDEFDAEKIINLISNNINLPQGANVLDLACGNGRHSLLLAKKGFNVTGIDLSPFLISEAKKSLNTLYKEQRNLLNFQIRDMRKFSYPSEFDLIINLFSSFGYFDSDDENELVIKCISESLKKNGFFIIDYLNSLWLKNNLITFDVNKKNGNSFIQIRNSDNKFVKKNIIISKKDIVKTYNEKIRLFTLTDFNKMFSKYGMVTVKVFGNYKGDIFNEESSQRIIIFTQKIG